MKKLLVLIFVIFIILPSISFSVSSQEEISNNSLAYEFLRFRFDLGWEGVTEKNTLLKSKGKYFSYQMRKPVPIQPHPESISINYLNETTFIIGGFNEDKGDWEPLVSVAGTWNWAWMMKLVKFSFEFVPPENASEDVWNVIFNPNELIIKPNQNNLNWLGWDTPFKTNVTIMLKPGVDPRDVTQDIVLKVNIRRTDILDKLQLWHLPAYVNDYKEEYIQKCEDIGVQPQLINLYQGGSQLIYMLFAGGTMTRNNWVFPFVDDWIDSTIEVLIKVNKFHLADILPIPTQEIQPYEVKSIPLTIRNIGSHIDTYNFEVRCDDKEISVTPPPALTLKPGESGEALVGVAAPKSFLSIGATTSIFVDAYSIDDPDKVFTNTIILQTIGVHTTGGPTINAALLIISLVVIGALYLYFSRKIRDKICVKPDKPWEISDEKKHLEKLKEKDKEKYNKTLKMMNDEYNSALLWHKYYVDSIVKKKRTERIKQREKKAKEKVKEKAKVLKKKKEALKEAKKEKQKKEKEEEKKEVKKEIKEKEPEPKPLAKKEEKPEPKPVQIDRKVVEAKKKKELIIKKIRVEQEKQRKKFGKSA
jgi:hypothetical protein